MWEQAIHYFHFLEREAEDEKLKRTTRGISNWSTGALNVKCAFTALLYIVCFMLELLLAAKSHIILMAEHGVSPAGAAASAKCGCKSQRVDSELCSLPGLNWVAQRENILNA